jgi:hypothetical protein
VGDDPFIPVGPTASSGSSNAVNYFINSLGKPSFTILVVAIGLALGLSIGALAGMAVGRVAIRAEVVAMIEASERRTMDRAGLAEREARIALDEVQRLKAAQSISTDH